jgi:hypothetical protein
MEHPRAPAGLARVVLPLAYTCLRSTIVSSHGDGYGFGRPRLCTVTVAPLHARADTGHWTPDTQHLTLDTGHRTLDTRHCQGQVGGKPLMVRSAPPVTAQRARAVAGAQDPLVDAEEELIKKFFTA